MSNSNIDIIFGLLEDIEKKSKITDKLKILEKLKLYDEFKTISKIVYDKNIKTFISYNKLLDIPCGDKQEATFEDFVELVGLLSNRKIVGKEALNQISNFLSKCDSFHCKWYKRILAKDLRIGVGSTIINRIFAGEFKVKVSPMLSYDISSIPKVEEFIKSNDWYYEYKIDGLRCLMIFNNDTFECFSRNGKRLQHFENLLLTSNILDNKTIQLLQGLVLDGEIYSTNWSGAMSSVFTKNSKVDINNLRYYVFDIFPIDKISKTQYEVPYEKRKQILRKYIPNNKFFVYVDYHKLTDTSLDNIQSITDLYINQGWEGIVLKKSNSPYVFKRSKYWIKVKKFHTIDVLCTGIEISKRRKGEISAIKFKYKGKECKCGSGFTQSERQAIYRNPDIIIGKIVELKYQEVSKDGCLRFPIFVRIREDKTLPDA